MLKLCLGRCELSLLKQILGKLPFEACSRALAPAEHRAQRLSKLMTHDIAEGINQWRFPVDVHF